MNNIWAAVARCMQECLAQLSFRLHNREQESVFAIERPGNKVYLQ